MQPNVFKASLNSTGGNTGEKLSLDIDCIASRAISEGNPRMSGIALGELARAARARLVGITVTHLANCFPVSINRGAGESKDRADFPEGHGFAETGIAKSQNTSPFGRSANSHSV